MCGILGVVATSPVNQLLYDGLQVLQHRGQDAAGIATSEGGRFHMHKGSGLVRDVFRTRNMRSLTGQWGIGHCRYPTAGSAYNPAEAQPFYVNSPFGLMLAHNGNLTNSDQLKQDMFLQDLRHMNTNSSFERHTIGVAGQVEPAYAMGLLRVEAANDLQAATAARDIGQRDLLAERRRTGSNVQGLTTCVVPPAYKRVPGIGHVDDTEVAGVAVGEKIMARRHESRH